MFRTLSKQKECRIEEGHVLGDHVHMLISIPPKYAVAQVVGFIKGKSAIHLARNFGGRQRNFTGCHFWARTHGENDGYKRIGKNLWSQKRFEDFWRSHERAT